MRAIRSRGLYEPVISDFNNDEWTIRERTYGSASASASRASNRNHSMRYPSPATSNSANFDSLCPSTTQVSPSAGRAQEKSTTVAPSPSKMRKANISRGRLIGQKPRFVWSKTTRQALYLLRDKYQCDMADTLRIFNEMFRDELASYGFRNGIEKQSLSAQYGERKKETSRHWQEILKKHMTPREIVELEQTTRAIERHLGKRPAVRGSTITVAVAGPSMPRMTTNQIAIRPPDQTRINIQVRQQDTLRRRNVDLTTTSTRSPVTPPKNRTKIDFGAYVPPTPSSYDLPVFETPPSRRRPLSSHVVQDYDYVPITHEAAHPQLPALFYRFYDDESFGVNDANGFIASQCVFTQGGFPPPPQASDPLMFMLLENHMNRNPVSSPFISVSFGLFWVVRMALKSLSKGNRFPRVAIIDSQKAAQGNRAFFVRPYHKEMTNKGVFTDGAWRYCGTHEWVIWASIPGEAVIHDISAQELRARVDRLPSIARAFRFDVVGTLKHISNDKLRLYLKDHQVALSSALTIDFAHLLLGFGVDATAPEHMIAKLVCDFIQGWQIAIDADSHERWKRHASIFAFELSDGIQPAITEGRFQTVENAFLCGLGSGLGDFHWQKDAKLTRRMQKRADAVGLDMESTSRRLLEAVVITARPSVDLNRYRYRRA